MCTAKPTTNITIYRLTPINYTGVTNMDTGDAAGDVMFGLNQLLLPQLCPQEPSFVWCANRQYLSGGGASMVYTEFVVEADIRFGEYNKCNPDPATGVFACDTYGGNAGVPRQCAAGFEYEHEDCLEGVLLSNQSFLSAQAEAECCAACTAAGGACSGWNLGNDTDGRRECAVLTGKLTEVPGAQSTGCKAAYASAGAYACWYSDPAYNTSFAGQCDPNQCVCGAVSNRSVGREEHAMCWNDTALSSGEHSQWFEYVGGLGLSLIHI
eukprot:TRINITY_DN5749_c0_g1_i1.p1 TRINITY_DN5749_c0_g1~~TRINITY_DN5749_c0_g1_i1.p1  ORF type:complete len:267 (-),score=47.51 TRINITY_DN5749_c0_g1_i1:157-957(-)